MTDDDETPKPSPPKVTTRMVIKAVVWEWRVRGRRVGWTMAAIPVLYLALSLAWKPWPEVVGGFIALNVAMMIGWKSADLWRRTGGYCNGRRVFGFRCPGGTDGCAGTYYTHIRSAPVEAFANRHLAEVHKIEAPQWIAGRPDGEHP